ncbi:MAG: SxtJ family membrane protein [Gammaproteobacteria bacterium]|nr:SxtJ family membrane protein [Gammaproteobacteria bacterium]
MAGIPHEIPELDRKGLREFGITTGAIVAGLFGLFFPWVFERAWPVWPWIVFGVLGAWGLIAPMTLRPVYRGWMRIGLLLSKVMTPLIMGIVFYILITPMALFRKLMGKDSMARDFDDSRSYRVPSDPPREDYLKRPY